MPSQVSQRRRGTRARVPEMPQGTVPGDDNHMIPGTRYCARTIYPHNLPSGRTYIPTYYCSVWRVQTCHRGMAPELAWYPVLTITSAIIRLRSYVCMYKREISPQFTLGRSLNTYHTQQIVLEEQKTYHTATKKGSCHRRQPPQ